MNGYFFALITVICYLISGLLIGLRLFNKEEAKKPARAPGIALGFLGLLFHAVVLYQQLISESGLSLGFFNSGSLVAWLVLFLVLISSLSKPVENLGIVILPLAALSVLLSLRYHSIHLLTPDTPPGLKVHVLTSLLAYSLLSMASVQAILLAIQDYHLRHRHPGGFIRALPPLQTMESLLFEMIGAGFLMLTLALGTGVFFLEDMFAQRLVHKTVLSLIAWLVFGLLLWGRFKFGWRGKRALIWTLSGFVVLMLAYFGSKFVIELVLHSG
ncbi:MAG: cytochrome c biogenesis protein CcsA [Gammaproteobacteria bacterium]|nr:cytochrome c biogenesis protein CcsA [Gammaproteobacteria bacterium]